MNNFRNLNKEIYLYIEKISDNKKLVENWYTICRLLHNILYLPFIFFAPQFIGQIVKGFFHNNFPTDPSLMELIYSRSFYIDFLKVILTILPLFLSTYFRKLANKLDEYLNGYTLNYFKVITTIIFICVFLGFIIYKTK